MIDGRSKQALVRITENDRSIHLHINTCLRASLLEKQEQAGSNPQPFLCEKLDFKPYLYTRTLIAELHCHLSDRAATACELKLFDHLLHQHF